MRGMRTSQSREERFENHTPQLTLTMPDLVKDLDSKDRLFESVEGRLNAVIEREEGTPVAAPGFDRDNGPTLIQEKQASSSIRARKMEAMGTLASGIAHDFNNILTPILLRTEMAIAQLEQDSPLRYQLEQVLTSGQRARDLVKQILNFSSQNDLERKPLQISLVVKELLRLLRSSLPATIEIQQDIAGSGMVLADLSLIHLLAAELCIRLTQPMSEKGGVLQVSVKDIELNGGDSSPFPLLPKGSYVNLSVKRQNNDPLMVNHEEQVAEEEEMGSEFALIRDIVDQHGGRIAIRRTANNSMTCHVFLPTMEDWLLPTGDQATILPRGKERILLVDDEKEVLETLRQTLIYLGYTVFSTTSGPEALELFSRAPDQFDLLVTDQTMPKMTGVQLASEVSRIKPGLPVLLCSGFGDVIQSEEVRNLGVQEVVMKPLTANEIAHKIRQVLERIKR